MKMNTFSWVFNFIKISDAGIDMFLLEAALYHGNFILTL